MIYFIENFDEQIWLCQCAGGRVILIERKRHVTLLGKEVKYVF